eukprot:TRINITY_DN912_c3_g1_i1.p1 TRINITY_DN912_c3_g1~~TRINITY_DN912_c3_g1_i1.p1  ORF type:complete len:114 (+),score=1.05 TRINITY_DN912_c3_g1_i1:134-475(+)
MKPAFLAGEVRGDSAGTAPDTILALKMRGLLPPLRSLHRFHADFGRRWAAAMMAKTARGDTSACSTPQGFLVQLCDIPSNVACCVITPTSPSPYRAPGCCYLLGVAGAPQLAV